MNRREFLKSALVTAGVVTWGSLGGCARREEADGRITLTQWYHQYGEEGTQDAVLRYARDYTKANPDVAVNVVWVPGDYGTKLNTALLTAGGPDVFEKQLTVPMVSAGQIAPLDDLFPPEVRRDFVPADLLANTVDGHIYGVKMIDDTGLIYYRKSWLKETGLRLPQTLDELIVVAKALTKPRRKGLYLGNDGGVGAGLNLAPWSAGEDFLKDDKIVFNTPRTVLAYQKLRELVNSNAVLIGAPTDWWDPSAFNQGLCAMQWCGLWAYPAIHKALGDDVGALAWPALDAQGTPATFFGGWSQMVNSRSPHLDEAKRYVRHLWIENSAVQRDWNLSYGFHVPPRVSIAREARALDAPVPATAVKNLKQYGRVLPPAWSGGMNTALSDAVVNIVKIGRPAAEQIAIAARKCERELERMLRFRD
jgi:multiple sugar transport system substrate-binding protein